MCIGAFKGVWGPLGCIGTFKGVWGPLVCIGAFKGVWGPLYYEFRFVSFKLIKFKLLDPVCNLMAPHKELISVAVLVRKRY